MEENREKFVVSDTDLRPLLKGALVAEAGRNWELADRLYRRSLELCPHDHRLMTNLANVLWWADRAEEALPLMAKAATLAPTDWQPQRGLGNVLRDLNRWEEADRAYSRARQLDDHPLSAWNHSQLLIGLERYNEAFRASERRLELPASQPYPISENPEKNLTVAALESQAPVWLWSEQGFGDTLQYLRWLLPLCGRSGPVLIEVEPPLKTLLQKGLSWLPRPPVVVAKGRNGQATLARPELKGSLLSLPHLLGGAPSAGDWPPSGYLRIKTNADGRELRPLGRCMRVGVVWAAGQKLDEAFTEREYRRRSLPAAALGRLLEGLSAAGCSLCNLQFGPDRGQAEPWHRLWDKQLPEDADFYATAVWIQTHLDLVISVDTAAAHLCGAVGFPCWVLLPWSADPRWLRQRSDSPWYPSLRLWRQPSRGLWAPVIDAIIKAVGSAPKQSQAATPAGS